MLITVIAALALALTNSFTMPYAEKNKEMAIKESLGSAFPDADDFKEKDEYFEAIKDNEVIGRVYNVGAPGYSSIVQLLVGVDMNNVIQGVAVVSQQEAPGLGAKVVEVEFLDQFKGKELGKVALSKDGGEIDAITGATITSRAAVSAIKQAEPIPENDRVSAAIESLNDTNEEIPIENKSSNNNSIDNS